MKTQRISFPVLALLSSGSTLICCVLPALFVTLGFGSVVAGFIGTFPQITWLSENKGLVFGFAGVMIAFAGVVEWKRRNDPCPIDPELAKACGKLRTISKVLWFISAAIFLVSVAFVYVVPKFLE